MKLKYTETTEHEKEIELPYYAKYGETYYKIVSDHNTITVSDYEFSKGIETRNNPGTLPFSSKSLPITETEFDDAYSRVLDYLLNMSK